MVHRRRLISFAAIFGGALTCPTVAFSDVEPRMELRATYTLTLPSIQSGAAISEALPGAITLGDAVRRALAANANIRIQAQQVRAGDGAVLQARAAYDTDIVGRIDRERTDRPMRMTETRDLAASGFPGIRDEESRNSAYRIGVERTLQSGMRAEVDLSINSSITSTNTANGVPQQTMATVRFALRVPLQRNAGGVQQSSALQASEYEREASTEDLVQTGAGTVLSTVQTYWELVARLRRLDILHSSEQRAGELVAELRKLITADQIPAAELNLALASEAEKRASRAAEEQQLQQSWTAMGRLLNANTRDVFAAQIAVDPLPDIDEAVLRSAAAAAQTPLAHAIERRADLRSARLRERAAYALLLAAKNNLRPQFDLVAGVSTNGLAEGASALAVGATLNGRPAPAFNVGVELRWPYGNDASRGLLLSRAASHDQASIRMRDLERSIVPSIITAAESIRRTGLRYRETQAAAERYLISVQNERTKRRLGLSTLIDILNVQDRLDNAQLALLQLRQEYASLIAQLLFETGALVLRAGDGFEVNLKSLQGVLPAETDR